MRINLLMFFFQLSVVFYQWVLLRKRFKELIDGKRVLIELSLLGQSQELCDFFFSGFNELQPRDTFVVFGFLLNFERKFLDLGNQIKTGIVHDPESVHACDIF